MHAVLIILASVVFGPACIKIEMAAETEEQKTEASDVRAREYRVAWIERFERLSLYEQGRMVGSSIDSLSTYYLDYGYRVAQDWRSANQGQGTALTADDMRSLIEEWNRSQKPLMQAYEGALEYGLGELKRRRDLDQSSLNLLQQGLDLFYEVYNGVFSPSGTPDEYERRLDRLKMELASYGPTVEDDLRKYR
jgi:hypothetical protein